jgi:hypothetical protein
VIPARPGVRRKGDIRPACVRCNIRAAMLLYSRAGTMPAQPHLKQPTTSLYRRFDFVAPRANMGEQKWP